ncbi:hypothetical protein ES703_103339 [subsurface metagenome]
MKTKLLGLEAVMLDTGAVIVLWFAVEVSNASANNGEFNAGTCQIGVYLS